MYKTVMKWSLAAGSIYFTLVSIAHLLNLKIPVLFVYFDVPSFAYQNRIIGLLSLGWAMFFFLGVKLVNRGLVRYIIFHLVSGVIGIAVFSVINLSSELRELVTGSMAPYWIAMAGLSGYLALLSFLYIMNMTAREKE
jgi:hypothetical protein